MAQVIGDCQSEKEKHKVILLPGSQTDSDWSVAQVMGDCQSEKEKENIACYCLLIFRR